MLQSSSQKVLEDPASPQNLLQRKGGQQEVEDMGLELEQEASRIVCWLVCGLLTLAFSTVIVWPGGLGLWVSRAVSQRWVCEQFLFWLPSNLSG